MQFLFKREYMNGGDIAIVNCSHQCNILLMDDSNFARFRRGDSYRAFGGFYKLLPARIAAPNSGNWNVVLHLGGGSATIRHSIGFLKS